MDGDPGPPGYGHYRWMRRFVGLFGGAMTIPVPLFAFKNITIRGSMVGSPQEMKELMDLA